MTKEELLDHFALQAMTAQIQKLGIISSYNLAHTSYRMALDMMENRQRIHAEWQREEEQQRLHQNADLHELALPIRYFRCLTAEGIYTKAQLCSWDIRELRRIPNLGLKGLEKIKFAVADAGLKLKGQE